MTNKYFNDHAASKVVVRLTLLLGIVLVSFALIGFNYWKLIDTLEQTNEDSRALFRITQQIELEQTSSELIENIKTYQGEMIVSEDEVQAYKIVFIITFTVFIILIVSITVFSIRKFRHSVTSIANTLNSALSGDLMARASLGENEILENIGKLLDDFLDERVAAESRSKQENEELNNAVINLLHGVHRLSKKDLTARVAVTEDATGPIADSLNLLADEIAMILRGVVNISDNISLTSLSVRDQSDTVLNLARDELAEVELANKELLAGSQAMMQIAELAQTCNAAADEAINTTSKAKDTVEGTVNGITSIRETIRETEKRIKRLGERSQEISSVVSLINSIAERTHILALNASMHAASAGEAGRGFAVVADEVQRLAENAREATAQISSLVNNIQAETSDAVSTMNRAISEVVSGTQLAEQAGEQMQETMEQTDQLVNIVQKIAISSSEQAKTTNKITERAKAIKESTEKTNSELQGQSKNTDKLVEYSSKLVEAVGVFTLPKDNTTDSLNDDVVVKPAIKAV
jgi:methyl-accepting chemotaxis protein